MTVVGGRVGFPSQSCVTHEVVDLSMSIATIITPESVHTKRASLAFLFFFFF